MVVQKFVQMYVYGPSSTSSDGVTNTGCAGLESIERSSLAEARVLNFCLSHEINRWKRRLGLGVARRQLRP